jgi:superfamily II RNA helicase
MLTLFDKNEVRVRRGHVLNQVSKFLVDNEMLPALCFVFSITKLEKCAEELNYPLLEFDSKVPYTVDRECEQILRRLPNYKEYLVLPEYIKLVALLQKGIGIHHSKMIPVLREIVELLFARGLIKMLFCTTSVAIGLNLPVKTSIFTDIYKHNGEHICILEGHEYVQAAGRAGRLGIDVVGNVIHLNNLFPRVDITSYKKMLRGAPQKLVSNFKVSYNLLLNSVDKELEETALVKRSMIQYEISGQLAQIKGDIDRVSLDIDKIQGSLRKVPDHVLEEYVSLKTKVLTLVNKKRKDADRTLSKLEDEYKTIVKDAEGFKRLSDKNRELLTLTRESQNVEQYLDSSVSCVLKMLETDGFVGLKEKENNDEREKYQLLLKGRAAAHFREVPCLLFTNLVLNNRFHLFSTVELIGFLSSFTNIKVSDDKKCIVPTSENKKVKQLIQETYESTLILSDWEIKNGCNTGTDYSMIFDITDYIMLWSRSDSEQECRLLLLEMSAEKDIFLGEFVKAILKIVAIAAELAAVAELVGDMELLEKCRQVPLSLQKFVATNQSLYV